MGSLIVAFAAPLALPKRPPWALSEPFFDAEAFYQAHPAVAADTAARTLSMIDAGQARPRPAAGLTQAQMDNAYLIVEVGRQMQLPRRAFVVALTTALQETNLRNLANPDVPESLRYPHDATGNNADSIGLFQQRPSMGWGTVKQLMDPVQAASRFYTRLISVGGWSNLSVARAAQAVQRSAFPDAYADRAARAQEIADVLT